MEMELGIFVLLGHLPLIYFNTMEVLQDQASYLIVAWQPNVRGQIKPCMRLTYKCKKYSLSFSLKISMGCEVCTYVAGPKTF